MKNTITIDMTNDCACSLIANVDDGSNSVFLEVISDVSKNPVLCIHGTKIAIDRELWQYQISKDWYTGSENLTFYFSDNSHTGKTFTIIPAKEVVGNLFLKQIDDFTYQLCDIKKSKLGVTIGTVKTLPAGSDATVTNSGDEKNVILNFGIPGGNTGPAGSTGEKGDDAILLMIDSSNGNIFKNSEISTTLTVNIIVGGTTITSSRQMKEVFGNDAKIIWKYRKIGETEFSPIPENDPRISDEGFIMTLTAGDIDTKIVFSCDLDY